MWLGERPKTLGRLIHDQDLHTELESLRNEFVDHVCHNDFLPLSLVRSKGRILGYLDQSTGILEAVDHGHARVLFDETNVYLFRDRLIETPQALGKPLEQILPVGLSVSFDARKISRDGCDVEYQACVVLAGTWPSAPHPTAFPGGPGTISPTYNNTGEDTFYYLQLDLKQILDQKLDVFMRIHNGHCGNLQGGRLGIQSPQDLRNWKAFFEPVWKKNNNYMGGGGGKTRGWVKKENWHRFQKELKKEPTFGKSLIKVKSE